MIELRKAKPGEEHAVAALWSQVFGDDEAFLSQFHRLCVPFERMLALTEDGVLRSILCAPELTLRFPNGRSLKSGYMYALATDPAMRGRGFGKDTMRYGEVYLKDLGADCAVLVPAEPSLFEFFDCLKYVPAFSHIRREFSAEEVQPLRKEDRLAPAGPVEYNRIRRRWLEGRFYTDCGDDWVEFQQYLAQACGGDIYRLELPGGPGCAVVEPGEDAVAVKELLCAPEDVERALALLCARHPGLRYVLRQPVWTGQPGERVTWGAIRWLYDHPSPWCPEGTDGYLGLALD